ncbi:hypothetical protein [Geobacter sp. AOG1]|uniref:hypothetical protein n=1 Tax=Geobacter sp. AOG1 TaxID=1566346 RepID=UPI001CC7DB95|nr:hypothetical protein [Geobacter sp. AOG1]GFE57670.1 hypothetical protein AOG1_15500 [Geobacter sp. AOG1]
MKIITQTASTILIVISLAFQSIAGTTSYSVIDLGSMVTPTAINNKGQVVGYKTTDDGHKHAFLYENQLLTDLGTFGGTDSEALGINESGYIVGNYSNNDYKQAFQLYNAQFTDLFIAAGMIEATGINDHNVIIGSIANVPDMGENHVILYDNGSVTDLSAEGERQGIVYPGIKGSPRGINNLGQAILFQVPCGSWECEHSYLYSQGTFTRLFPFNATDINDVGQVVGSGIVAWVHIDGFIYQEGEMTRINDFGGSYNYPTALNNLGQVIGTAQSPLDFILHPYIYYNGIMTDLNTLLPASSGWNIEEVRDINDKGQIIGSGLLNGERHAFIFSPLVQTVRIDIRPSDPDNEIKLRTNGKLTVAIFGSAVFDATAINPESVTLAGADVQRVGKGDKYLCAIEDVNGDGIEDFICHIYIDQIIVEPGASSQLLELEAETFAGQKIRGEDRVYLISKQI